MGPHRDPQGGDRAGDDRAVVAAIRAGDEAAFLALVERHGGAMMRLASFLAGPGAAEDVVQESWVAVLRGLAGYEGRAPLGAWILSIVANRARSAFGRAQRTRPFSSLEAEGDDGPAVDPARFRPPGAPQWPGGWVAFPPPWPEERVASREAAEAVRRAIETLPPAQREVITLRDVEGWSAGETCAHLGISAVHQRVLLHRARSRVRGAIDAGMIPGEDAP